MKAAIDNGLTVQQGQWAALVARGLNYSEAYTQAYKCKGMTQKTINEKASRLAANPNIKARVGEILREIRVEDIDQATVAFHALLRHIEMAEEAGNLTALAAFDRLRLQFHGLLKAEVTTDSGSAERDRELIEALAGEDPKKRKAIALLMGSHEVFPAPPKLVVDNDGAA